MIITKNILINSTVNEIKQHFSMSGLENTKVLPTLCSIRKMHKSSVDIRFIIGNRQCVIKSLNKNILAAFKLLQKSIKKRNKSKFYSGVKSFWMIQNNKQATDS